MTTTMARLLHLRVLVRPLEDRAQDRGRVGITVVVDLEVVGGMEVVEGGEEDMAGVEDTGVMTGLVWEGWAGWVVWVA